mmetsp:Transcript_8655/g.25958  ORF Transcript_8655/g.25958 Transcript_8655/m.25958 type:complete len:99 (+) Transcript_8655:239-535(+)
MPANASTGDVEDSSDGDGDNDAYTGFGDFGNAEDEEPPSSPAPPVTIDDLDAVTRSRTLERVRKPTGPSGRRKPSVRASPYRHSRALSGEFNEADNGC